MSFIKNTKSNFDKKSIGHKIICFGYGNTYSNFLKEYPEYSQQIIAVIDNNSQKWNYSNIYGVDFLEKVDEPVIILITSLEVLDIKRQLIGLSVEEDKIFSYPFDVDLEILPKNEKLNTRMYYPAERMAYDYSKTNRWESSYENQVLKIIDEARKKEAVVIPYCTVLVNNICTLNCRDCNNLIPYSCEHISIDKKEIIKSIDCILDVVDLCVAMNFTGGEPFLYKDLVEVVEHAIRKDKITAIEVITNGTVIPNNSLCDILKDKKVIVKVSNYLGYTKEPEIKAIFEERGINYLFLDELSWMKSGGITRRNKEIERLESEYQKCWAGMFCKSIFKDKLYHCARAAFLDTLEVGLAEKDHLDISDDISEKEILDFYLQPYADACDFCDHHNYAGGRVKAAIQIKENERI